MSHNEAILLLGSNRGIPEENLKMALELLEKSSCVIKRKSKVLKTEPVEFESDRLFCNIAIEVCTALSPVKLLKTLKGIEQGMGRETDSGISRLYTDRIIDIDIVTFNSLVFISALLEIPHRRHLFEREFSKELIADLRSSQTLQEPNLDD